MRVKGMKRWLGNPESLTMGCSLVSYPRHSYVRNVLHLCKGCSRYILSLTDGVSYYTSKYMFPLRKYLSFNKNTYKNYTFLFHSNWFLYKIVHRFAFNTFENETMIFEKACPRGVIVKAMAYGFEVSEFEIQSSYYVHFRTNTFAMD